MSFFTLSGHRLAASLVAAGALVVGGTGVAVSLPGDAAAQISDTESQTPTVAATDFLKPTPTVPERDSLEPASGDTANEERRSARADAKNSAPEPAPKENEDRDSSPDSTPVGPDATGPAAFGLCNAYTQGGLDSTSVAHEALAKAAGGEGSIASYCEDVPAPQEQAADVARGSSAEASAERRATEPQGQPQQVQPQRQGAAPAAKGNAGHAANNSQSGRGQR